jgi:hypothetical protein
MLLLFILNIVNLLQLYKILLIHHLFPIIANPDQLSMPKSFFWLKIKNPPNHSTDFLNRYLFKIPLSDHRPTQFIIKKAKKSAYEILKIRMTSLVPA